MKITVNLHALSSLVKRTAVLSKTLYRQHSKTLPQSFRSLLGAHSLGGTKPHARGHDLLGTSCLFVCVAVEFATQGVESS